MSIPVRRVIDGVHGGTAKLQAITVKQKLDHGNEVQGEDTRKDTSAAVEMVVPPLSSHEGARLLSATSKLRRGRRKLRRCGAAAVWRHLSCRQSVVLARSFRRSGMEDLEPMATDQQQIRVPNNCPYFSPSPPLHTCQLRNAATRFSLKKWTGGKPRIGTISAIKRSPSFLPELVSQRPVPSKSPIYGPSLRRGTQICEFDS